MARLRIVIRDANDVLLEQGDLVRADGLWWIYTIHHDPDSHVTGASFGGNRT